MVKNSSFDKKNIETSFFSFYFFPILMANHIIQNNHLLKSLLTMLVQSSAFLAILSEKESTINQ